MIKNIYIDDTGMSKEESQDYTMGLVVENFDLFYPDTKPRIIVFFESGIHGMKFHGFPKEAEAKKFIMHRHIKEPNEKIEIIGYFRMIDSKPHSLRLHEFREDSEAETKTPLMDKELAEHFSHVNPDKSEYFGLDRTVTRVYAAYESASCGWKWYALEYEPKTGVFFGYVMGKVNEYGSFDIATLQNMGAVRVPDWDNTRVMEEFEPQDPELLLRDYREDTAGHE